VVDNDLVSKKIKTALRDLVDALEKHAAVTAERPTSSKRAGRATAKVRSAAAAYTAIVAAKTGQPNPFVDFLDDETVASLRAERDAVARKHDDKKSASSEKGRVEIDEKKSDSKKSDSKKSDSKKSDEKKSDEKKSDKKKSGSKKSDSKKSEKKKSDSKGSEAEAETTAPVGSTDLEPDAVPGASTPSSLFVPPLPHAVTVDEDVAGDTDTDPARDLTAMTLVQLRELAREAGLSGVSRASKATLIEHLHQGATR
jgi:flagellar biosynthesis GTPase FlhF